MGVTPEMLSYYYTTTAIVAESSLQMTIPCIYSYRLCAKYLVTSGLIIIANLNRIARAEVKINILVFSPLYHNCVHMVLLARWCYKDFQETGNKLYSCGRMCSYC